MDTNADKALKKGMVVPKNTHTHFVDILRVFFLKQTKNTTCCWLCGVIFVRLILMLHVSYMYYVLLWLIATTFALVVDDDVRFYG